ncbi:hypothetical protein PRIPAC_89106 [Pristionchus pacificus]|nr:hypothetical protein PRIPAC_89106 [Pristionchus pacificus]
MSSNYNQRDLDVVTKTMWHESRGEPELGQIGVAHVIKNRADANRGYWGGRNVADVCLKSKQFACWNNQSPDNSNPSGEGYDRMHEIARGVLDGRIPDPTRGALYYNNPAKETASWVKVPEWSDLVKLGVTKDMAPDWYYILAASGARRLYIYPLPRVNTFRNSDAKASGSVIRKALESLYALKWVDKSEDGKGRILPKQGRKDLDRIAADLRSTVAPLGIVYRIPLLNGKSCAVKTGVANDEIERLSRLNHPNIVKFIILLHLTITGQCIPKIADFGIAREIKLSHRCPYTAPELLVPENIEGTDEERITLLLVLEPRIDTWASGCLVWEILTGIVPYQGCYNVALPAMVAAGSMLDIVEIGAEVYEEMRCMADEGWTAEQQRYLAELAKHGFKARSAADMRKTRDLQIRKKFEELYKECWAAYFRPILQKMMKEVLMLCGKNERSATNTVLWISDYLYKYSKSAGYRRFARAVERPIAYVLCNVPIFLRNGPGSENFIPYYAP